MPAINSIPDEYSMGFQELFLLDEGDFKLLVDGLKSAPLTSDIDKLSKAASAFNPEIYDEVERVLLSVGSLTSFIEKGLTIEEISNDISNVLGADVSEAIEELGDDEQEFSEDLKGLLKDEGKKKLTDRLIILLNTERLYYAAKANDLMWEYPNVLLQSRIITDFRPIFGIKIDDHVPAGVVIHTLNIHYRGDDQKHKDIYFALDSADLKALKDILLRAEQKEESLIAALRNSGMKIINN